MGGVDNPIFGVIKNTAQRKLQIETIVSSNTQKIFVVNGGNVEVSSSSYSTDVGNAIVNTILENFILPDGFDTVEEYSTAMYENISISDVTVF